MLTAASELSSAIRMRSPLSPVPIVRVSIAGEFQHYSDRVDALRASPPMFFYIQPRRCQSEFVPSNLNRRFCIQSKNHTCVVAKAGSNSQNTIHCIIARIALLAVRLEFITFSTPGQPGWFASVTSVVLKDTRGAAVNTQLPSSQSANKLLALLPVEVYQRLAPHLTMVTLSVNLVLYKARARMDYVCFPTSGIVSAMSIMQDGSAIEVATIGNEGMAGLTAFIGGETSPHEVMVQVAGDGLRMSAEQLKKECRRDSPLRALLVLYHTAFSTQVAYAVACNGLHKVEQRCCRWLLMTADRVGADELPLTHEFLAIMLGVRRSSVTEVLRPLQNLGLIRNSRGTIKIVDRTGLEARACECYRAVKAEFSRLFG